MARDVIDGHLRDATLFPRRHRLGAAAVRVAVARLHLDEYRDTVVPRHDVDLAEPRAVAALDDVVSAPPQLGAREVLTHQSERLSAVGHDRRTLAYRAPTGTTKVAFGDDHDDHEDSPGVRA